MAMREGRRIVVKKKGGAHAHHGGAWKVAYADFVTAMMALFMVMWLLASTDQQTRKEISQYFRTGLLPDGDLAMNRAAQLKPSVVEESPMPPTGKNPTLESARSLKGAILRMIVSDPELADLAAQVSIKVTEEGVLIETADREGKSMLFDLASSDLKPALVDFLHKLGPMLGKRGNKIRIMGHTDARPYVSKAGRTNWDLSYERATKARRVLETSGLVPGQIIAVQAHGPSQLRNPDDPYSAENRRLSILVIHAPEAPAAEAQKQESTEPVAPATEAPSPAAIEAHAPEAVEAPAPEASTPESVEGGAARPAAPSPAAPSMVPRQQPEAESQAQTTTAPAAGAPPGELATAPAGAGE